MQTKTGHFLAIAMLLVGAARPAWGQWPRPPRAELALAVREFPVPFTGYNQAYCNYLAFSKDGTLLATAADSNIVVWDVETRKVITRMQLGEKQYAINVAFTEDGKALASNGTDDNMIRFWDAKTGRQISERLHAGAPKELPPRSEKQEHRFRNPFLAFAPGGRLMAAMDPTFSHVNLIDTASGAVKVKMDKAHSGWRGDWAFSGDAKLFATSSMYQPVIKIWNTQTGDLVRTLGEERKAGEKKGKSDGGFTYLRFGHNNKYVFGYAEGYGGKDYYVSIWGVDDGLEYCRIPVWAYVLEMSPDERAVIVASGGRFFLFDLLADKVVENVKLPAQYFYHVQRSPDGLTLALLGGGGTVNTPYSVYLAPFPVLGDDSIPKEKLSPADLRDLWAGLSSSNVFRRRYVARAFQAHAEQAVALVEEKVKPAPAAARQRVMELIKALDDDEFEKRDVAMKELRGAAFRFEPLLRETMKSTAAGEVRNRLRFILGEIADQSMPAELLAELRGVELLEKLATPAARKSLTVLAGGAPGARTTLESALALKRIGVE